MILRIQECAAQLVAMQRFLGHVSAPSGNSENVQPDDNKQIFTPCIAVLFALLLSNARWWVEKPKEIKGLDTKIRLPAGYGVRVGKSVQNTDDAWQTSFSSNNIVFVFDR